MGDFTFPIIPRVRIGRSSIAPPKRQPTIPPPPPAEEEQEDRDLVTITGSSGGLIDLNHSHSFSSSKTVRKEVSRTYDEVRVKNPDNPDQHVDVKNPTKVKISPTTVNVRSGGTEVTIYAKQPQEENVEVLSEDNVQNNPEYDSP